MKTINQMLCLVVLLLPTIGFAQKDNQSLIDQYMQAQVTVNEFSGVILVANKGLIIYKKPFGYADREWKIPNSIETKFEIGSLTKQFTATAILQLAEQDKLNLNDKLSKYFPGYPKGDSVTLHMLLTQTSGIVDYTSIPEFYSLHTLPLKTDSVIALFKNKPYLFSPGSKWSYSNSNYFLLGCIIEKVTSKAYRSYMDEIIKKAGLKNTFVNQLDSILDFRARGYSKLEKGGWKNSDYMSMELPYSAGSMISTVEDLFKWQNELLKGMIISKPMVSKMTTPNLNNYGYGLIIDSLANHVRISHAGAIPGFTSFLAAFPADRISIAVLSNDDCNSNVIGDAIASILFNIPVEIPYITVERAIDTSVIKRYAGKYQLGGSMKFELFEKDHKLYLKPEGQHEWEMKPESETRFFFSWDKEQKIDFLIDSKGVVTKCYFMNKGSKIEIKRLN